MLAGGYNNWVGYGRWMQLASAVGWWQEKDRLKGQAITYAGDHFQYEGTWNGTLFKDMPIYSHKITDLSVQFDSEIQKKIKEMEKENAKKPLNMTNPNGN